MALDPPWGASFAEPWRAAEAASLHAHETPTGSYLQVCIGKGIVPSLLPFVTGHSAKLDACGQDLADGDLEAVTAMIRGMRVELIDLSDCVLLTERSLVPFIDALMGRPAAKFLTKLSLKRCLGTGPTAMDGIVRLINDSDFGAKSLRELDLTGIFIGHRTHPSLSKAIRDHVTLSAVRLAETGLGSCAEAKQCVLDLASSTNIETLDLSWNCFSEEVLALLGERIEETAKLRVLRLANCSAFMKDGDERRRIGSRAGARLRERCSPIVFFMEALARSSSLTCVDLSMNRVDFRAALVLEDALETNRSLTELDVSQNPLGIAGTRSLLRVLACGTSGLVRCNLEGCLQGRHLEPSLDDVTFGASNPSGRYRLDLSRPEDRSMLRMLYRTADRYGLSSDAAFTEISCAGGYAHATKDKFGSWGVQEQGIFRGRFDLERMREGRLQDVAEDDFGHLLDRAYSISRMRISFRKIGPLLALWRSLDGNLQEQLNLIDALSDNFLFSYAHVKLLCSSNEVTIPVLRQLLPCMEAGSNGRFMASLLSPSPSDMVGLLRSNRSFLQWNPENPTGHYKLQLSNNSDRVVAEQLLLLDRWEAGIAKRNGYPDISQKGNRSLLRNETFMGKSLPVPSAAEWHLPMSETFEFDYSSYQRPPPKAKPIDEGALSGIMVALRSSECPGPRRVDALRAVAHRIYLTSLQMRKLLSCLRDGLHRVDLVTTLIFRIVDIENEKIFRVRFDDHEHVRMMRLRLGYLAFFPFIQPEQSLFELHFSSHDQRLAGNLLCVLAAREGTHNIRGWEVGDGPTFIRADGTQDPLEMGVPRSWESFDRMPTSGIFRARYSCAPEERKFEIRRKNLETYGLRSVDLEACQVMWWSGLQGVPEDVITYLLFLVAKYSSLSGAFRFIDGPDGNGDISLKEFTESVKKMKFKKFKGPDEIDRLKLIFRFLDPSGEGSVSIDEWSVMEQLWQEMRLTIVNFVDFLDRMFEDLEDAWQFYSEDAEEIELERFTKKSSKGGYFGQVKVIFAYLDKDGEGSLSWDEFELLAGFREDAKKSS
eukprot:TRINITY_DN2966_c1_g1_i2.p1 TRINITY_DN2966_c1_g1~~TRINITY_DN2966_c1_g1_i2.p1  ORF type:complete len:1203 (+),score=307.87 TRINITY_DN2966_c1_g1_i2:465-3611(+)